MANPVASIQIGVNLIDDYLYLEESPVQQDLSGRFVAVHNPSSTSPTSELVTVNDGGQLVHFMADPASNSGWSTTVVTACKPPAYGDATSDTILRLAAYYDKGGILNVLAYYPTSGSGVSCATWMQRTGDGTWTDTTDMMSDNAKNALAETYQTDVYVDVSGNGYFYGVSGLVGGGAFFVATYDASKNAIDVIYSYPLASFPPAPGLTEQAAFRMAPGSGGDGVTVLWVDTPKGSGNSVVYSQEATITVGRVQTTFTWSNGNTLNPDVFSPNAGTLSVSDMVGLPGEYGTDAFLLRDSANGLYLVKGYNAGSASMTALTGSAATQPAGVVAMTAGADSTGTLTIFATESNGSDNLWYLQQPSPTDALSATGWVNLGGKHFAVACRSSMVAGPELYTAEFGASGPTVYHMDRSLTNPVWSTRKVAAPVATSATPANIASYTMELTTLDAYGNIVPSTWLSVTTDQAATLIWNLVAYHVGPNTPIEVQTDGSGQASVQLQCESLKPPVVTYAASANGSTVSRWCQGDVVQVMDPEEALPPLPDSVAPTLKTVTGQTLLDQKLFSTQGYDTQSAAETAANNTAQAVNATGAWMVGNPDDPSGQGLLTTTGVTTPHWQLDFTDPQGPRFRVLTRDEARAIVARSRDGSAPALLGGSLGSVFGDVAHFFKKEWKKLHTFSSSLENDVLTVTLEAEEGTQSFVISTVKEAGAALETVFAKIKQIADDIYSVIAEVVAWLKALFDWEDILNTQKAINACVTQTLANIQATVADNNAQAAVHKWISTLKNDIGGYFKQLEDVFEPGTSYNSFANSAAQTSPDMVFGSAPLSDSTNILAGTPAKNAQKQHASKCNYVYSKTKAHYAGSASSPGLIEVASDSSGIQPIIDAIMNNIYGSDFNNGVAKINTQLKTLGSNPGAIFDLIIVDFLNAAQDAINVVLDGLEAVIDAIIQVATDVTVDVFKAVESILNTEIPIPVISWLWTNIIDKGQPLTLLNLISLTGAVISTILYKVLQIDGGNPPFSSDVSAEISGNLPWPALPSASPSRPAIGADHGTPPSWSKPLAYVGAGLMVVNGVIAAETDLYAYDNAVEQDETGNPPPPNPSFQFWSVVSWVFGIMIAGSGAPYKAIYDKPTTGADGVTIAYWGSNMLRLLVDIITTVCGPQMAKVEGSPNWGPVCKSTAGLVSLVLAIAAAIVSKVEGSYSPWATANMVIRPISPCAKFLLMTPNAQATTLLILLEGAVGVGAGLTQYEKTKES